MLCSLLQMDNYGTHKRTFVVLPLRHARQLNIHPEQSVTDLNSDPFNPEEPFLLTIPIPKNPKDTHQPPYHSPTFKTQPSLPNHKGPLLPTPYSPPSLTAPLKHIPSLTELPTRPPLPNTTRNAPDYYWNPPTKRPTFSSRYTYIAPSPPKKRNSCMNYYLEAYK